MPLNNGFSGGLNTQPSWYGAPPPQPVDGGGGMNNPALTGYSPRPRLQMGGGMNGGGMNPGMMNPRMGMGMNVMNRPMGMGNPGGGISTAPSNYFAQMRRPQGYQASPDMGGGMNPFSASMNQVMPQSTGIDYNGPDYTDPRRRF